MDSKSVIFSTLLIFSFSSVLADPALPEKRIGEEGVSGMVMDMDSKKPLKDVNITAVHESNSEKMVFTDTDGGYRFILRKPGMYKLIFEKAGYKKIIKENIRVNGKSSLLINIEMPELVSFYERGPSAWHFFEY